MKCPDCKLVCSDLRDICPKCLSDLREHKVTLGIPVTNSTASYQELVNRMKRLPAAPDRRISPGGGALPGVFASSKGKGDNSGVVNATVQDRPKAGFFGKLFGSLAVEKKESQHPVNAAVAAPEPQMPAADSVIAQSHTAISPHLEDAKPEDNSRSGFKNPFETTSSRATEGAVGAQAPERRENRAFWGPHSSLERFNNGQEPIFETSSSVADEPVDSVAASIEQPAELPPDNQEIPAEIYQSQAAAGPKVLDFSAGDDLDQVIDRLLESELESPDIIGIESLETVDHAEIEIGFQGEAESHAPDYVEQALSAEVQDLEMQEPAFDWMGGKTGAIEELVPDKNTVGEAIVSESVFAIEAEGDENQVQKPAASLTADAEDTARSEEIALQPAAPDITVLFEECYKQLSSEHSDSKFELSSDQLLPAASQDEIRILFDLAYDELKSPASVESYKETAEIARTVRLESEELRAHLEKVEQQASGRQISLKAPINRPIAESRVGADVREAIAKPQPAFKPLGSRQTLAVWLADLGVIAFAALLFATFWLAAIDMNYLSRMMKAEPLSILQFIDWLALVGVSFLMGLLLIPLASLFLWGRSIGQIVFRCQVCDKDGAEPQLRQLALRALLQPLNLLGFGWVGACFGRRMLADWLSSTRLRCEPEAIYLSA